MKVTLMMYLNQSILQLYQTYKKSSGTVSGWIIDSVIENNLSISKCNPLAGSSYIKLPKELDHPRKELLNIQNIDDNECFKWGIVRYLILQIIICQKLQKLIKVFPKSLTLKT